jgi:hypothetical protein
VINNKSEQATPPDNLIFLIARFDQILQSFLVFLFHSHLWHELDTFKVFG